MMGNYICKYKDYQGYCRHKKNQERGRTQMKCCPKGCPFYEGSII